MSMILGVGHLSRLREKGVSKPAEPGSERSRAKHGWPSTFFDVNERANGVVGVD